jgi:hypothetical protein
MFFFAYLERLGRGFSGRINGINRQVRYRIARRGSDSPTESPELLGLGALSSLILPIKRELFPLYFFLLLFLPNHTFPKPSSFSSKPLLYIVVETLLYAPGRADYRQSTFPLKAS